LSLFCDGKLNITKLKSAKEILTKVSNALFILSKSPVFNSRLAIGGTYHKKYYTYICKGFFNGLNTVFMQKNVQISEFVYNLKQNMCNFGIYFYKENNQLFLKIYAGNSFLIDINQQNFIESYLNKNNIIINNKEKFEEFINFYEKNYLKKISLFNFEIESRNNHIQNQIEKYKLSQNCKIKIVIEKDLEYKILDEENNELNKEKIFKNYKKSNSSDDEIIKLINLTGEKKFVNKNYLLYNELTNNFDVFKTLKYISWRVTNDKNHKKLV